MSFKLENFGADASNVKSILGGANYYRYFNKDNNTLTTPGYFPADLGLAVGDRIKVIPSVKTNPDELYVVTSTANRTVTVTQIDTDGAVDSVNGKTGNVVLDASDVGALPDSTVIPDAIQVSALPTASADEEGKIYQFIGTTDASYTNGYFYKCVSDGQNPATYSWVQTSVQPAPSGLPDQSGQSGKFLTTDGTDASWENVGSLPDQSGQSGKFLTTDGTDASWGNAISNKNSQTNSIVILSDGTTSGQYEDLGVRSVIIGNGSSLSSLQIKAAQDSVAIGAGAQASGERGVSIGRQSNATFYRSIGIGDGAKATASSAIQLGGGTNSDADTFKVGNNNGNFELMSADGTIPADRIASTSGLADGNYRLRLTMLNGVPTLTWVAE